ncbi:four-carbon acid sugar kinase family protein [Natronobiforma cellulositropha]|uniref:four-carbon acid sugar kinase family protein n=1 Tax=Natronobiforma cellulositropha TaxID=1679076 RepID=UPI0021D59E3F|nr:four-carbon acid sugar kinase family protein [Natronobiforma cellulositropha]
MNALVVADDLTGAMDTGHGFAARGYETAVWLRPADATPDSPPPATAVLALTTESRDADAETARARVVSALETVGANGTETLVYDKVDSTLRGNVVAELEATLETTGAPLAVVAPAFPAAGRRTRDGQHTVDGLALERTAYARDEAGPETGHLPTLFDSPRYRVGGLTLETVAAGADAIASRLCEGADRVEERPRVLVCDATDDRHLRSLADAAAVCEERVVYVGSGGLARHVTLPASASESEREHSSERDSPPATWRETGALGVVGSVNDRTLQQLRAVPEAQRTVVDAEAAVAEPDHAGRTAGAAAARAISTGENAVVTAATVNGDVERALEAGGRLGYDTRAVRARVRESLAVAARTVVEETGTDGRAPAGVFATGGAVAMAVFDALEASALELTGDELEEGIPLGRLADGPAAGTPVVTKAGGFGSGSTIGMALKRLGRGDEPQ